MPKLKVNPFFLDILSTAATSMLIAMSNIFLIRILAKGLGPDSFGLYSLARRIVSFIFPFSSLSIGVSLTRYIALSSYNNKKNNYLVASILILLCTSSLLLIISLFGGKYFTLMIFHDSKYLMLFYSSIFMVIGLGFFRVVFSYYRGIQKIYIANIWQIFIVSILSLIISYVFVDQGNVTLIVFLLGGATYISIIPLIRLLSKVKRDDIKQYMYYIQNLLKYGIPRTPGGIALEGVLTIGPFLALYFGTMRDAGYIVVGQSVFRIIETSVVAFGLVALPKISQIYAEGKTTLINVVVRNIITMIVQVGLFVVIHVFIWSNDIVLIWLGTEYLEAVPIIKIYLISLCPYLGYVMLRSVVDAVEKKAVNTINLFFSFGVSCVFSIVLGYLGFGTIGLAIGASMGFVTMGISTAFFLIRRYNISFVDLKLILILTINCLLAGIALIIKRYLIHYINGVTLMFVVAIVELILFVTYIAILYNRKIEWIVEIKYRFLEKEITTTDQETT